MGAYLLGYIPLAKRHSESTAGGMGPSPRLLDESAKGADTIDIYPRALVQFSVYSIFVHKDKAQKWMRANYGSIATSDFTFYAQTSECF